MHVGFVLGCCQMRSFVLRCAVRTIASTKRKVQRFQEYRAFGRWRLCHEAMGVAEGFQQARLDQAEVTERLLNAGRTIYHTQVGARGGVAS